MTAVGTAAPVRGRTSLMLYVALFLGAAALSAITVLHGIQPNDEGLMLQAAARILGPESTDCRPCQASLRRLRAARN